MRCHGREPLCGWGWSSELASVKKNRQQRGRASRQRCHRALSDPTSGFMAVRKSILDGVNARSPGLENCSGSGCEDTSRGSRMFPLSLRTEKRGKANSGLKAQVDYLRHLVTPLRVPIPSVSASLFRFCVVGPDRSGGRYGGARFSGGSMSVWIRGLQPSLLSRRRSPGTTCSTGCGPFESGRSAPIPRSYAFFVSVSLGGLAVRIGVMHLLIAYAGMGVSPWYILASFVGIGAATVFNFLGSRTLLSKADLTPQVR